MTYRTKLAGGLAVAVVVVLGAAIALSAREEPVALPSPSPTPTVASLFSLAGTHWVMHAGQWAIVRRQLGRPPLF